MQVLQWVCISLVNVCYGWMCYGKAYSKDGFKMFWKSKYFSLGSMRCLYPKACVKGKEATLMNLSYFYVK